MGKSRHGVWIRTPGGGTAHVSSSQPLSQEAISHIHAVIDAGTRRLQQEPERCVSAERLKNFQEFAAANGLDISGDACIDSTLSECGLESDGSCRLAGSEYCDWDCPFRQGEDDS